MNRAYDITVFEEDHDIRAGNLGGWILTGPNLGGA